MDLFKKCYEDSMYKQVQREGIYPYFHQLETKQDIVVEMEGKREIMIGSNNYLGLTGNQEVIDAAVEATKEFGTGCSGSRFFMAQLLNTLNLKKTLLNF